MDRGIEGPVGEKREVKLARKMEEKLKALGYIN
jgi:hypothetical protein